MIRQSDVRRYSNNKKADGVLVKRYFTVLIGQLLANLDSGLPSLALACQYS